MKPCYLRVIGVDVASEKLDVNDSDGKIASQLPNTAAGIAKQIVGRISDTKNTLVVCEATDGYEHLLVDAVVRRRVQVLELITQEQNRLPPFFCLGVRIVHQNHR